MEMLEARMLLCFYENLDFFYFGYENTVDLEDMKKLSDFKSLQHNALLVSMLSNTQKIVEEIDNIKEYIKDTYSNTSSSYIKFPEKNLVGLSPLFKGISNYANQYCRKKDIEELDTEINFCDGCIYYLDKCIAHLKFIKDLVDSYFNLEKNFDESLTANQRIIVDYFKSFSNNALKLPESTYLFATKSNSFYGADEISLLNESYDKFYTDIDFSFKDKVVNEDVIFITQYKCKDFIEILNVLFYQMMNSKGVINKCQNCKRYFIPQYKSNEKYCDNISPDNPKRTCKDYAAKKTYRESIKSNSIKTIHTTISQKYRMRRKRAKTESARQSNEKKYNKYQKEYQNRVVKYNAGKISEEEFIEWLNKQREEDIK